MTAPPPTHGAIAPNGARLARVLPLLSIACRCWLWHLLVHLPLTMLMTTPLTARVRAGDETLEHRAIRAWSAGLMRVFGFRLRRVGTPLPGATMFVANHVSWIDIETLHSQRMMGFVAKREIQSWPVVGWLAQRAETIFHARGSTESLGGVLHEMLSRLRNGRSVGVFPEGGTRGGARDRPVPRAHLPGRGRGRRAGAAGGAALRRRRLAQHVVAFQPRESFFANFLRLLGEPARMAEVHFLEPIAPGDAEGRRRIAELARNRIIEAMNR